MSLLRHLLSATALGVVASTGAAAPPAIPGYAHGAATLAPAPYTVADLAALQKALLFTEADVQALRRSKPILEGQTDAILDVWYGFVAATPELLVFFTDTRTGKPDGEYLAAVRRRFARWILNTADARYDQAWLDWQYEIGLRHHRAKKNQTDGAHSSALVNYRYLSALTIPVTTTLKPFLARQGATPEQVEAMHAAWVKSVLMQTILWSYPYVRDGDF
ncbi:MAG: protogloblin ApPgb [Proteobacteria bacterium]|nr:protogloblin ApPgb [Pseudomonadota bacterium]